MLLTHLSHESNSVWKAKLYSMDFLWLPAATVKAKKKPATDINLPGRSMRERRWAPSSEYHTLVYNGEKRRRREEEEAHGQIIWQLSEDVYVDSRRPDSEGLPVTVLLMKRHWMISQLMTCNLLRGDLFINGSNPGIIPLAGKNSAASPAAADGEQKPVSFADTRLGFNVHEFNVLQIASEICDFWWMKSSKSSS